MLKFGLARRRVEEPKQKELRTPTRLEVEKFKDAVTRIMSDRSNYGLEVNVRLEHGCPNQCPFCAEKAPKGPEQSMPIELAIAIVDALERIPKEYQDRLTNMVLWYKDNDPLTYPFLRELKARIDISSLTTHITTAVPVGKEDLFVELVRSEHPRLDLRLSLTAWNKERLMRHPRISEMLEGAGFASQRVVVAFVFIGYIELLKLTGNYYERFHLLDSLARHRLMELGCGTYFTPLTRPIKDRMDSKKSSIIPLIGDEHGALISQFRGTDEAVGLQVFTNIVSFSKAVVSGMLKPGELFVIESIPKYAGHAPIDNGGCYVETRDWNLQFKGRIEYDNSFQVKRSSEPYLLIDSNGRITKVNDSYERELSPPVV